MSNLPMSNLTSVSHDRMKELEEELNMLQKLKREEKFKYQKVKEERIQELKKTAEYEYSVSKVKAFGRLRERVKRAVDFRFIRRTVTQTLIDMINHMLFVEGFISSESEGVNHSDFFNGGMSYYLTSDGIIHYCGGGSCILDTPQLCTPEEWEQIKAGNIPAKFLKENNE